MTAQSQNNQEQTQPQTAETKISDKELNFRALEAKYQKALENERQARLEAEKQAQEVLQKRQQIQQDDEDDDEPYVDKKRLEKKLYSFEKRLDEKIDKKAEEKARVMLERERNDMWLKQNPDFYDVMQKAERFAEQNPELAETILQMPEGFERQKLVYKNIKALGLHKPDVKQPSIQDKIDANKRSPYYQPTGVNSAPYNLGGDFTPAGKKSAYEKMQELKSKLRI